MKIVIKVQPKWIVFLEQKIPATDFEYYTENFQQIVKGSDFRIENIFNQNKPYYSTNTLVRSIKRIGEEQIGSAFSYHILFPWWLRRAGFQSGTETDLSKYLEKLSFSSGSRDPVMTFYLLLMGVSGEPRGVMIGIMGTLDSDPAFKMLHETMGIVMSLRSSEYEVEAGSSLSLSYDMLNSQNEKNTNSSFRMVRKK